MYIHIHIHTYIQIAHACALIVVDVVASCTDAKGLTAAIESSAQTYQDIGKMHAEQVKGIKSIRCRHLPLDIL